MLINGIIKILTIEKYVTFKKFININLVKDEEFTPNNEEDLIELEDVN